MIAYSATLPKISSIIACLIQQTNTPNILYISMPSQLWPYVSPGIPDELFEYLPGIPLTQREIRLLLISQLRLKPDSVYGTLARGLGQFRSKSGYYVPKDRLLL